MTRYHKTWNVQRTKMPMMEDVATYPGFQETSEYPVSIDNNKSHDISSTAATAPSSQSPADGDPKIYFVPQNCQRRRPLPAVHINPATPGRLDHGLLLVDPPDVPVPKTPPAGPITIAPVFALPTAPTDARAVLRHHARKVILRDLSSKKKKKASKRAKRRRLDGFSIFVPGGGYQVATAEEEEEEEEEEEDSEEEDTEAEIGISEALGVVGCQGCFRAGVRKGEEKERERRRRGARDDLGLFCLRFWF